MSFVIGKDSARLIPIAKAFKKGRLDRASSAKAYPFERFNPIFCNETNYLNIGVGQLTALVSSQSIPCTESIGIEVRRQFIPKLPGLDLFFSEEGGMRISNQVSERFKTILCESLDIIKTAVPWMSDLFDGFIDEVVVVDNRDRNGDYIEFGFSHYSLIGGIFQSERIAENALIDHVICTAHELSHNVLDICLAGAKPFQDADMDRPIYSGVRKTYRPALLSFHAAMALSYMIIVIRGMVKMDRWSIAENLYLKETLDEYLRSLDDGLKALKEVELTKLGRIVNNDFLKVLNNEPF